jgi:hypothetical protein
MGTFEIKATRISSGATPYTPGGNPPPDPGADWITSDNDTAQSFIDALYNATAFLQAWCTGAGPSAFSPNLVLNTLGYSIYLDGSTTPITFSSLPAGFTVLTATLSGTITPSGIGAASYQLAKGTGSLGTANTPTFPYTISAGLPTMLDLYADGFGINVAISAGPGDAESLVVFDLKISGTYEIQRFSWTLDNPETKVTPGTSTAHFTSAASGSDPALDFTRISQYFIQYIDNTGVVATVNVPSGNISVQTGGALTFTIPNVNGGDTPPVIIIGGIGDGTQFSGSMPLGELLTIFFTNGSGIYRLVTDKTDDTLYVNGTQALINVKIPDPFIKTAFLP